LFSIFSLRSILIGENPLSYALYYNIPKKYVNLLNFILSLSWPATNVSAQTAMAQSNETTSAKYHEYIDGNKKSPFFPKHRKKRIFYCLNLLRQHLIDNNAN